MNSSRRNFLRGGIFAASGLIARRAVAVKPPDQQQMQEHHHHTEAPAQNQPPVPEGTRCDLGAGTVPVETPDVPNLPYRLENGVKEFHLIAEPVKRRIAPFKTMEVWGFNGSCPGPTLQVNQGDRVRIIFDNHLPESTSLHWHGLEVPPEMDGVPYLSQEPVPPGGRFF